MKTPTRLLHITDYPMLLLAAANLELENFAQRVDEMGDGENNWNVKPNSGLRMWDLGCFLL